MTQANPAASLIHLFRAILICLSSLGIIHAAIPCLTFPAGPSATIQVNGADSADLTTADSLNLTTYLLHHDIELLPSGNILAIAWEMEDYDQCVEAGHKERLLLLQSKSKNTRSD